MTGDYINARECDNRYAALSGRMSALEKRISERMKSIEDKFWAIIILTVANLGGIIATLVRVNGG